MTINIYYEVESYLNQARGDYLLSILNVMLNAVLWLTGICLCQAVIPQYRPLNWNLRRKSLEPWHRARVERQNNTRFFKHYTRPYHCYKPWPPPNQYRKFVKPPFQFYPYYTENPLVNCFPFLNPDQINRFDPMTLDRYQQFLWDKNLLMPTYQGEFHRSVFVPRDQDEVHNIFDTKDQDDLSRNELVNKEQDLHKNMLELMCQEGTITNGHSSMDQGALSRDMLTTLYQDKCHTCINMLSTSDKECVTCENMLLTEDQNELSNNGDVLSPSGYDEKNNSKKIKIDNDFKFKDINLEDYSDVLFNDSCLQLSKNDTVIISPTILIGRKNSTSPSDDWILSNRPINIYVKKLPNNKKILKVLKNKNSDSTIVSQSSRKKFKKHKVKNHYKNEHENFFEEFQNDLTTKRFAQVSKKDTYGFHPFQGDDMIWDSDYPMFDNNSIYCSTEKCKLITHPIKNKIQNTYQPYIYPVGTDQLRSVNDHFENVNTPKKLRYNVSVIKPQMEAELEKQHGKLKKNRFRRFYYFPNLRGLSKRSCLEHKKHKRMQLTTKANLLDYLDGPEYYNYYEYNLDDIYPQNAHYQDNTLLNDYSYLKAMCAVTSELIPINNKIMMNNTTFNRTTPPYIITNVTKPPSLLGPSCKNTLLKPKNSLIKVCTKSELPAPINLYEKYTPQLRITTPNQETMVSVFSNSTSKIDSVEASNFLALTNIIKQQPGLTPFNQDVILKNFTDELKKKISVLTNLTLGKLIESNSNVPLCCLTTPCYQKISETMCPLILTTHVRKTTLRKAQSDFSVNYEDERPLLESMFVSPNKAACERMSSRRCVCSPKEMMRFFSDELQKGNDAKILLKKIITYSCEVYVPITINYQIAADMKPRLISKKKRELIESSFGPKEISPLTFDELMMRGLPKQGVDFFVFPSTTVEIPCFTSDEMKLSPNIADSALYKWSHSNLKAITEGRILEDANHKGSLIIQDVTLGDSDNYTCSVKYIDPDSQITVKRVFVHSVKVVVLPRMALHTNMHYSASSLCDQELLEMFELYLPQQIEASICNLGQSTGRSLCSVEIHNPVCYTRSKQDSLKRSIDPRLLWRTDFQKSRWIREILNEDVQEMEISLNYELDLAKVSHFAPEATNWSSCSPHCQQKLSLKTIDILRDSFLDALLLPVKTKTVYFQPSLDSINIKMLTACDGGLELKDGFCIPCKKHYYSEQGKTVCMPCPRGTYQDNIGAKSCVPCPHPFRPNCFYLGSLKNFTVFIFTVASVLILLVSCWLGGIRTKYLEFIKRQAKRHGRCSKSVKSSKKERPEPLPPDFE